VADGCSGCNRAAGGATAFGPAAWASREESLMSRVLHTMGVDTMLQFLQQALCMHHCSIIMHTDSLA